MRHQQLEGQFFSHWFYLYIDFGEKKLQLIIYHISGWFFRVSQNLQKRRERVVFSICRSHYLWFYFLLMLQNIFSTYSIFCNLKEIAKIKRKLDHRENYQMYGMKASNRPRFLFSDSTKYLQFIVEYLTVNERYSYWKKNHQKKICLPWNKF